MISIFITCFVMLSGVSGDFRVRSEYSWPSPSGVRDKQWQDNVLTFYQRIRLNSAGWDAVFLTEKDPGESWGDLVTGGLSYIDSNNYRVAAGALRVQFAHGLAFSHPGPWSGTDPLALSKSPKWRMLVEVSESPSASDANALNGISSIVTIGDYSVSTALGWSKIDPSSSGLHQTDTDILNQNSITDKLAAIRMGYNILGLSYIYSEQEDAQEGTIHTHPRAALDINIETDNSVLTGELALENDSSTNFLLSAGRGLPDFRHTLSVSRNTTDLPRSSNIFGSVHNLAAGYGLRWRPLPKFTVDAGILYYDRIDTDQINAAVQFTEQLPNRFSLTERFKLSTSDNSTTTKAQLSAVFSPFSDLTLSLKFPFTFYRSDLDPDENGSGVEIRLKHSPLAKIDLVFAAAAASTDGWNSRVYAYSLSFPGEFGSKPLYNSSRFIQSSLALHLSDEAILRIKGAWFSMPGEEYLGSGDNETEGSSKTTAGLQLDWKF